MIDWETAQDLHNIKIRLRILECQAGLLPTSKFVPCTKMNHQECPKKIERTDGKIEMCLCGCHYA